MNQRGWIGFCEVNSRWAVVPKRRQYRLAARPPRNRRQNVRKFWSGRARAEFLPERLLATRRNGLDSNQELYAKRPK
jgi:hypothetical protein